ncbi:MAG TPA: hypothetical protein VGM86_29085 [Thermoanaerobaculia bacterium]|jgi:hypothetical protein
MKGTPLSAPNGDRISRGQLTRFVSALTQALYDRMLEDRYPIVYYYDANVMIPIVLGMEDPVGDDRPADLQTRLVWGLLSAGYLGKARILRPHEIELENALQRQGRENGVPGAFGRTIREFLEKEKVFDNVNQLFQQVKLAPTEEQLERFLELLRDVGPETFISLERAADGAWQRRLVRLNKSVLFFDKNEDNIREFLEYPLTWKFYDALKRTRGQKQEAPNSLRDAVALCQLAKQVSEGPNDGEPLVRFNTNSPRILSLATDNLGEVLTYRMQSVINGAERWRANMIFRNPDYYVMRASFEALRFPGLDIQEGKDVAPALTLADLERLCERLNYSLDADDSRMERLVEEIDVGERRLSNVVAELERLSFAQSVLSQYTPPGTLKEAIRGLSEVWDFMESDPPQLRLRAEIIDEAAAIGKALTVRVRGLRDWLACFRQIELAAYQFASNSIGTEPPDLYRDLGLVRWGEYLQRDDESFVILFCRSLVSGDSLEIARQSAALAWRVETATSPSAAMATCCLLWMLSLFNRVVDVVNRAQDVLKSNFPVSLNILRTAARLRGDEEFSDEEKWSHISALEVLVQAESEGKRGRLNIGLAYVAFYVWQRDGRGNAEISEWAEKSFQYGEAAASILQNTDPLGYTFAVNHCAYVGACADVLPGRTAHYLSVMETFRRDTKIWNYRFADTLAFRELKEGMHLWELLTAAGSDAEKEVIRKKACTACKRAEKLMLDAKPHFGDPEIPVHHARVQALLERLGCR